MLLQPLELSHAHYQNLVACMIMHKQPRQHSWCLFFSVAEVWLTPAMQIGLYVLCMMKHSKPCILEMVQGCWCIPTLHGFAMANAVNTCTCKTTNFTMPFSAHPMGDVISANLLAAVHVHKFSTCSFRSHLCPNFIFTPLQCTYIANPAFQVSCSPHSSYRHTCCICASTKSSALWPAAVSTQQLAHFTVSASILATR